jgi:hypothetical protein
LRQLETFAPSQESDTIALTRLALHTGRKRMARSLLDNYVARLHNQTLGTELLELQRHLAEGGGTR